MGNPRRLRRVSIRLMEPYIHSFLAMAVVEVGIDGISFGMGCIPLGVGDLALSR